jgi:hypothetical protein
MSKPVHLSPRETAVSDGDSTRETHLTRPRRSPFWTRLDAAWLNVWCIRIRDTQLPAAGADNPQDAGDGEGHAQAQPQGTQAHEVGVGADDGRGPAPRLPGEPGRGQAVRARYGLSRRRRAVASGALAALLVTLAGGCCVGDQTALEGQDEAVNIIWRHWFAEKRDPPPIYWRYDHCGEPNGIYDPLPACSFDTIDGRMAGTQSDEPWHVEVGAPWGDGTIADTALAHELLHASIGDAGHHRGDWDLMEPIHYGLKAVGL